MSAKVMEGLSVNKGAKQNFNIIKFNLKVLNMQNTEEESC
jgi:hypothetical protein